MPSPKTLIAVVALLQLAAPHGSHARRPAAAPCPDGRFEIVAAEGARLAELVGEAPTAIVVSGGVVRMGTCESRRARMKATRRATRVRARWSGCGAARRLRMTARIAAPSCDTLVGVVRAGARVRRTFTATRTTIASPALPSSGSLIAAALREGRIDYPTSLVYRAWTLYHDPRLPAEFEGSGGAGDDSFLFAEVQRMWSELPATTQAELEPYVVRPDDPRSAFGPIPAGATQAQSPASPPAITRCTTHWNGVVTPGGHFKIWLCATADSADDDSARAFVAEKADALWAAMTPAMGPPLPDEDGGDDRIDVYVLAPAQCRERDGECHPIPGTAVATAVPTAPFVQNARGGTISSGYVNVDRSRLDSMEADFAHELFHVLQFARNQEARIRYTGIDVDGVPLWDKSWFIEASATWAEWHWVPASRTTLHQANFVQRFQPSTASLLSVDDLHEYGAYIWPYFMHQELGESAVVKTWFDLEPAITPTDIDDVVDRQLPFRERFRDFAVRNLNVELPGDPLAPRYVRLDPDHFPDDEPPADAGEIPEIVRPGAAITAFVGVHGLAAQYDRWFFESGVAQVTFDFVGVAPLGALDVDAIVQIDNSWRRVPAVDGRLRFCRERSDEAVRQLYLVLANHDRTRSSVGDASTTVAGTYTITEEPCAPTTTTTTTPGSVTTTLPPPDGGGCESPSDYTGSSETLVPRGDGTFTQWTEDAVGLSFTDSGKIEMLVTSCTNGVCFNRVELRSAFGGGHCSPTGELHPVMSGRTFTDTYPSGQVSTHRCTCCFDTRYGCDEDGCHGLYQCCPQDNCREPCENWIPWPTERACPFPGPTPPTTTTTLP
jgi:hypothetical protein